MVIWNSRSGMIRAGASFSPSLFPVAHLESDRVRLVRLFLQDDKLPGADFVHQPLIHVLLDHAAAKFLTLRAQVFVALAGAAHTNGRPATRVAGEGNHHA